MDKTFCTQRVIGGFWFRIFGRGLMITSARTHAPRFSERMGHAKACYVVGIRIQYLPKFG